MPMPRKPKNEPPAVTMRWQRRQMTQMEATIARLRVERDAAYSQVDRAIEQIEAANRDRDMHASHNLALAQRATLAETELGYLQGYFDGSERILKYASSSRSD